MRIGLEDCIMDEHRSTALISCAEIYTHVSNVAKNKIVSPLDNLKLGKENECQNLKRYPRNFLSWFAGIQTL